MLNRLLAPAAGMLIVAIGSLSIACGGGGPSGPSYPDVTALADALGDAGIDCIDFTSEAEESEIDLGFGNYIDTEGRCTIEGEDVTLYTFKDSGAQKNWTGLGATFGCAFTSGFGLSSFPFIEGNLWAITDMTETTADKIAEGFGGTSEVIECD